MSVSLEEDVKREGKARAFDGQAAENYSVGERLCIWLVTLVTTAMVLSCFMIAADKAVWMVSLPVAKHAGR
jgi:hypothetical protein